MFIKHAKDLIPKDKWWNSDAGVQEVRNRNSTLMVEAMASCTAISYVDGSLVGDPLDVQMFEATGWILDEQNQRKEDLNDIDQMIIAEVYPTEAKEVKTALIRRFDFSSQLQRMSVIC